jgi:hypothetical protein
MAIEARKRNLVFRATLIRITTFNIIKKTLYLLFKLLIKEKKLNLFLGIL